ncbi:hypothetical protein R3I94_008870 [Phoxinus phoxinus]
MAVGEPDLASLGFINDTARMRSWHNSLNQAKIVEPTIQMYLKNVAQFLAYVAETPPPTSRLSRTAMVGLNREIKLLIRSVRRRVVVHEVVVKQAKECHLNARATLRQCVTSTKDAIPEILASLKQAVEQRSLFEAAVEGEDAPQGTPKRPATSSGQKRDGRSRKRLAGPTPTAMAEEEPETREPASEVLSPAKRRPRVLITSNLSLKYATVRLSPLKSPRKVAQKLLSADDHH